MAADQRVRATVVEDRGGPGVGHGPVAGRSGDARAVRLGAEAAMEKHTSAHPREVYAAEVGRLGDEAESQVMLMDAWQKTADLARAGGYSRGQRQDRTLRVRTSNGEIGGVGIWRGGGRPGMVADPCRLEADCGTRHALGNRSAGGTS